MRTSEVFITKNVRFLENFSVTARTRRES